jgi:hypothetical protein
VLTLTGRGAATAAAVAGGACARDAVAGPVLRVAACASVIGGGGMGPLLTAFDDSVNDDATRALRDATGAVGVAAAAGGGARMATGTALFVGSTGGGSLAICTSAGIADAGALAIGAGSAAAGGGSGAGVDVAGVGVGAATAVTGAGAGNGTGSACEIGAVAATGISCDGGGGGGGGSASADADNALESGLAAASLASLVLAATGFVRFCRSIAHGLQA